MPTSPTSTRCTSARCSARWAPRSARCTRSGHQRGPDRPGRERVRERDDRVPRGVRRDRRRPLRARAGARRRADVGSRGGPIPPEPRDPERRDRPGAARRCTRCPPHATWPVTASRATQLAEVAVKNRRHGRLNPRASIPTAVTLEEVLASRMIADPLTCCSARSISDGAAAAVLGPVARRRATSRCAAPRSCCGRRCGTTASTTRGARRSWRARADALRARGGRHRRTSTFRGPRRLHDRRDRHDRGARAGRGGRGRARCRRAAPPRAAARRRSTRPADCSRAGTRSARPGSPRSPRSCGSCAARPGRGRCPGARIGVVETMGGGVAGLDGNACVVAVLEAP